MMFGILVWPAALQASGHVIESQGDNFYTILASISEENMGPCKGFSMRKNGVRLFSENSRHTSSRQRASCYVGVPNQQRVRVER